MELLLHQWGDWPELYRNTDKTEATEIVIIDSQMNYRGKLDTYRRRRVLLTFIHGQFKIAIISKKQGREEYPCRNGKESSQW